MVKNNAKNLMQGALLLSVAALIAKILSAVYRVPFQNIVGNHGFYVYQQVYPIYGIGMTLALSGLPNFVSKLIAEQPSPILKLKLLKQIFWLVGALSLVIFLSLYFKAAAIAHLMGDDRLVGLIQMVSFMFLLTPFLTCLRGYFQGLFDMRPTAISQVLEQLLRVSVILLSAGLYVHYHWDAYHMGRVAMSGALVGGFAAFVVMLPQFYWHVRQTDDLVLPVSAQTKLPTYRQLARRLWLEGSSLSLFAAAMVAMQLIDSFTVAKGLIASGLTPQAAYNLKGIYDRAQPLVQLGLVVTMSFVTALLPALSNARQARKKRLFIEITQELMHIALALSAAAAAGLMLLMPWVNRLLFGDADGSSAIALYMVSVLLMALINVFSSVLQSLNRYRLPTLALLGGFLFKMVFNSWFTRSFGITGSSLITVAALAGVVFLIFLGSPVYVKQAIFNHGFIFKLGACVLGMVITVGIGLILFVPLFPGNRLGAAAIVAIHILIGLLVFIFLSIRFKLLTLREWLSLPLVSKILHQRLTR